MCVIIFKNKATMMIDKIIVSIKNIFLCVKSLYKVDEIYQTHNNKNLLVAKTMFVKNDFDDKIFMQFSKKTHKKYKIL